MTYGTIIAPAEGATLPVDTISGSKFPRTKISFGAEGVAVDVSEDNPLPVAIISGGGGGDASAANQDEQTVLLTAIDTKLGAPLAVTGAFYPGTQPVSGSVSITGGVAVTGTFWQATQPVSIAGTVAVSIASPVAVTGTFYQATQPVSIAGSVAVTGTFFQATQPVSAAALPLPTGAATAANQTTAIAAIGTIGTRAYGAGATRVAYTGTSAQSGTIAATEVMLHNCGTARCYVAAASNPTATVNDIPLEAGEKFTLRITSGHRVAVIQDSAGGNLNIIPVA